MLTNPRSSEQNMIRSTAINDMKPSGCSTLKMGPDIRSRLMWPRVNDTLPLKHDTLIGCSIIYLEESLLPQEQT